MDIEFVGHLNLKLLSILRGGFFLVESFRGRNQHQIILGISIYYVKLLLNCKRQSDGRHHSAVGTNIVEVEAAFPAIFQPFVADLVAADLVFTDLRGNRTEVLRLVDVHALRVGVIAKALRLRPCDDRVALALEAAGRWVEFRRREQMQVGQSSAESGEVGK